MLETIRNCINEMQNDSTTFEDLFLRYVTQVQDTNISKEISYMITNNIVSVELLDRAISDAFKELF